MFFPLNIFFIPAALIWYSWWKTYDKRFKI